ncbi:hypothetical protein SUGI_0727240 [Cryptomeria japonica]|uniref:sulfate transporter 3.1 isoform X2 n=1 Tax=Cryptomeria japonica TaxID=3369 RepID=UPI002414BACB|nr:sulfate transporter 3.1 isoform X2 [Cryptomeria japonica]GLJ36225.1 hypothetical protein SUGI_0727240 [Cryptomeria japonica]
MEGGEKSDNLEMVVIHKINVPPPQNTSFVSEVGKAVKETLFPDDPFKQFNNQPRGRKCILGLQFVFPILEWAPKYSFELFKSDLISGITIASLAIPQGISYAKLANLPPLMGLYSSFVPPLIYAMLGSSKDMAVGPVAVASILLASMLTDEISPTQDPVLYVQVALTATLFAGIFQACLGIFRLGFIIEFLSHATIIGFMAGAATIVFLQQMKGILGLEHFTTKTDMISVLRSALQQVHKWRWESIVLGAFFLIFLLTTRYISKRRPRLFWLSAVAPLTSIVVGSLLVFSSHAEKHGVNIVGHLKKGLNPVSSSQLAFHGSYMKITLKTGAIVGIIALTEGIAVGRTFSLLKNYRIDGNKEMIAIGMMNIAGSCTSCYISSGSLSRSAVNSNAGCKTIISNIVMAAAVMLTLLFLTPLFYYTPIAVLSSIIISAMLGLIDLQSALHLWKVDKLDFLVCLGGYLGVVFANIEVGLTIAVSLSMLRLLMHIMRPDTTVLGNIPGTCVYRSIQQYPQANRIPGILVLRIDSPIYFANANYIKDRLLRWIEEEERKLVKLDQMMLRFIVLELSSVTTMDTSGLNILEELKKTLNRQNMQLVLANPTSQLLEKLHKSNFMEVLEQKSVFVTVDEAVIVCSSVMQS